MKGRKPKPTHLKLVDGNPGKRPLNANEPKPRGRLSAAPAWLSDSQREGWDYAIESAPLGLLKRLDRAVLTIWVVAEDLHRQASMKVAQLGLLTRSPRAGEPMQNPYLPIVNKQSQIMLKAAAALGFEPTSRARISVAPEDQEDPAEEFFNG